MNSYEALAQWYDRLTQDIDYTAWADWLEQQFTETESVETVLDLACGTGTMSALLARKGYSVIGVNQSEEMLTQAMDKAIELPGERPLFLCQPMDELELFGTVDACVCCLDSINYITDEGALRETFRRIGVCLTPGGRFVFDVNTPEKLRGLDGEIFLDETEDLLCLWRAAFEEQDQICYYGFDLFSRTGELWSRMEEQHQERAWPPEQLEALLREAGFASVKRYDGAEVPVRGLREGRLFFVAEMGIPKA